MRCLVGLLAPFEYTALIWATLLGYFIWSEVPAAHILYEAGIIVSSGLYMIHRETLKAKAENQEIIAVLATDPSVVVAPLNVEGGD